MVIKSLTQMEKIVSNNPTLSWDGWDVLQSFRKPNAWMYPNGVFIKGKWYTQRRFKIESNGWNVPDKFVR